MTTWAGILRVGGLGDNLIASSVLPGLKKKYDRVEVISQKPQHVTFENNPYVDKLSVYSAGDLPVHGTPEWQHWYRTRSKEFAFFEDLSQTAEIRHALVMAQKDFWRSPEYRRKLCAGSYIETVADICGVPYEDCAPGFFPTDEELAQADQTKAKIGDRCVGWVVSGSRIDKIYPFASVSIARIIRDLGVPVILFGAPGRDQEIAKLIEENLKIQHGGSLDGFHIAISESAENDTWPIRRSLAQVQRCDLVIGPDTGSMWSVASCDMPKIMLLSHAGIDSITKHWRNTTTLHADQARVPCHPCFRLHDSAETCVMNQWDSGAACISDITADRLYSAVEQAWCVEQPAEEPRMSPVVVNLREAAE